MEGEKNTEQKTPNTWLKSLASRIKEQSEILAESIWIKHWQKHHGEAFREKNKNSKLVNPDVITIYRDGPACETKEPEYHWTEEELQEIAQSLRAKMEQKA